MSKAHLVGAAVAGLVADTGEEITDSAYLTDGANPPVFVVGDGSQRLAYYHQPVGPDKRAVGIALLSTNAGIPYENNPGYVSVHVNLGYKAGETRLQILSLTSEGIAGVGGQTPAEQRDTAGAYPDTTKISTLRANPTNPASLAVQVDAAPFSYIVPSTGLLALFYTNDHDFSGDLPAAGKHRLGLLCLNPAIGALTAVLGTAVTAIGTLGTNATRSEFVTSDYTALDPNDYIPIAYIYLYNGQTEIVEADIRRSFEPRLLFQNPAAFAAGVQNHTVRVVTAAGAVTITTADYLVCVNKTVGAATTVNLPSSPSTGDTYVIKDKKADAATNNITLTPASGNIDGAATYVMNINRQSTMVVYDGSEWSVN